MQMTPGRIATLAVSVPVALALIGWTGYSFVALAGRGSVQIATSVPVADNAVHADLDGADVMLRQAQVTGAELTGTAHYSLFRPVLTQSRTSAGISVDFRCRDLAGDCGLNATLVVPLRTGVTVSTAGGDLSVPAFTGSLTMVSGGGDVTAGGVDGAVQMATDGGDISASSLTGPVNLQTGGGDLELNTVAGPGLFQAATEGGDVSVQGLDKPDTDIASGGGDVAVVLGQVPRDLRISTDGGDIAVVLPPGSSAYSLQVNADGGDVYVGQSITVRGDAQDMLVLNSEGGDISVSEAS